MALFGPRENSERPLERAVIVCDEKEQAEEIVRAFWGAVPHGQDILRNPANDWSEQLEAGDDTNIVPGAREYKGKYIVLIRGSNGALTREAEEWLGSNNYI